MKNLIIPLLIGFLAGPAFANGGGDVTCFFLYQATDGSYPSFEDRTHMVQWGKPGTYLIQYSGPIATVAVETEIRTVPFDHAFMKISYSEPGRGLNFSSRGTLTPSDANRNQANLILETAIPPTVVKGVTTEKFWVSCLLTN